MGTKNDPGRYDCLKKAQDDEPYFVLLGRDASAPQAVLSWIIARLEAVRREERPLADLEQIAEAIGLVRDMLKWRADRPSSPAKIDTRPLDRALLDRLINRLDEIAVWL